MLITLYPSAAVLALLFSPINFADQLLSQYNARSSFDLHRSSFFLVTSVGCFHAGRTIRFSSGHPSGTALTQVVGSGCMSDINATVSDVSFVESSASSVIQPVLPTSTLADSSSSTPTLSKRAQKGKKDPPGLRNRQKKEAKLRLQTRVSDLSSSLHETTIVLEDAVAARDEARLDRDKAIGKAKQWEEKYRITKDAAVRERLDRTKKRLIDFQNAQNKPPHSPTTPAVDDDHSHALPAASSLLPAEYPEHLRKKSSPSSSSTQFP